MQVQLRLDGRTAKNGAPLVLHNERLADPLDSFTQAIQGVSKKRNKTVEQHGDIAYMEFMGGLYTDPPLEYPLNGEKRGVPVVPAWNILRCLQDGGRRHKRGMDVPRGVYPLKDFAVIEFEGPDDPQELWEAGGFSLRKSVGVQRSRTMRTRPMFTDWQAVLPIEVDSDVFDRHTLAAIWKDAGTYAGLGEMRPVYGRFVATVENLA
jgi:hypothetical protein